MGELYRDDVYLWSCEQSAALRNAAGAGANLPIDWENVAEEIESVALGSPSYSEDEVLGWCPGP